MPAMAAVQRLHGWQIHRHRRQASSHICFMVPPSLPPHRPPIVGAGLPAMTAGQALHGWQTHRHRRQASSHICFVVPPSLPPHRPPHCGSGLARDDGGPETARLADTPPSQASQLPHLFCGASKPPASPPPIVGAGLPAMAAGQALHGWQIHRHRRQASSYICFVVPLGLLSGRDAAWGALFGHLRRLQLAITRFLPWRLASYIAASARAKRLSRVASSAVRLARPWLTVTL